MIEMDLRDAGTRVEDRVAPSLVSPGLLLCAGSEERYPSTATWYPL